MPRTKATPPALRGMGAVTLNPNGTWRYRYRANGHQHEETFSTRQLAEDRQSDVWRAKRSGEVTFTAKTEGAVRFADYCGEWIEAHRNPNTRTVLRSTFKVIAGQVGSRTLAQIAGDREGAQRMIDEAPGTYGQRVRILLVSPCNEALKAGRIPSHRLRGLRVEPEARKDDFTPATRAQLDQMATTLGSESMIVWLGVYCGLRIGETLAVNISDFIMDGKVLRVQRQRSADGAVIGYLKARKPGEFRDVPVSREMWRIVSSAPTDSQGYLFPQSWRRTVMDHFNRARDLAGLPASYTPHSLRDQYATALLTNHVSVPDVALWLGHTNIQVTFRYYFKSIPSAAAMARDIIDQALAA
jgi:integrase